MKKVIEWIEEDHSDIICLVAALIMLTTVIVTSILIKCGYPYC